MAKSNENSVYKCLDASTAHIPLSEREDMIGVFLTHEYEDGWWLWVPPTDDLPEGGEDCPAVVSLLKVARDLGCRWISLDVDGDVLDDLPTYEESECGAEACGEYPLTGHTHCEEHSEAEEFDAELAARSVISPGSTDLLRCRYDDCAEQHPVTTSDGEHVTCAKCRGYMGLPKLCVKCNQPIPEPMLDGFEAERCSNCAD